MWFPLVDADMLHVAIADRQHLMRYVLHAKHSRAETKDTLLANLFGDRFSKVQAASGLA